MHQVQIWWNRQEMCCKDTRKSWNFFWKALLLFFLKKKKEKKEQFASSYTSFEEGSVFKFRIVYPVMKLSLSISR